jgi:spermidine synthase
MVGSDAPFVIDETAIEQRVADPAIAVDLQKIMMGSATDVLSYFVMGAEGMRRFGQNGTLNSDDRPYLEFSAPSAVGTPGVMAANVQSIAAHRESILPYLKPAKDDAGLAAQRDRWNLQFRAAKLADPALALFLGHSNVDPEFLRLLRQLNSEYPSYAPGRFLGEQYQAALALEPRLLQQDFFPLLEADGDITDVEVSAVLVPVSRRRASVMFVDNRARVVYGQVYVEDYGREGVADALAVDVMRAIRAAYTEEATAARARTQALPSADLTLGRFRAVIGSKAERVQPES